MAEGYGGNVWLRFKDRLGGAAHLAYRLLCTSAGDYVVRYVRLPDATAGGDAYAQVVDGLNALGYNNPDSKYLVLWQTGRGCAGGVGSTFGDESPGKNNLSNGQYGGGVEYAINIDCFYDNTAYGAAIEQHELTHTMGAVGNASPNATGHAHCRDVIDVMCYDDDGAGPVTTYNRCGVNFNTKDLDCWEDDYFAWRGTSNGIDQSYIRNHWNVGDCFNRFYSFYGGTNNYYCASFYASSPGFYQR